jgi:hypothetical protein
MIASTAHRISIIKFRFHYSRCVGLFSELDKVSLHELVLQWTKCYDIRLFGALRICNGPRFCGSLKSASRFWNKWHIRVPGRPNGGT